MFKKIFLVSALFLTSCFGIGEAKLESPVIYFSNASPATIRNIRVEWVKNNALTLPALTPGDSRSQSFYLHKSSDFFGLVKVIWTNEAGDTITREFYFRENNLPSINDHSTYNYVQIYFDQTDLEIVSSDAPDLSGKTVRMDRLLAAYKTQHAGGPAAQVPTSLISIEPVKDRSTPGWLSNSYN